MLTDIIEGPAEEAIRQWRGREGQLAIELQNRKCIDLDFLRRWLGAWMLARSNPKSIREKLAGYLEDARRLLKTPQNGHSGKFIEEVAKKMFTERVTKERQTSVVSKFGFSLRPEEIVPYDKRARQGLAVETGEKIEEHNYVAYLEAFHSFSQKCGRIVEQTWLTARLRFQ